MRRNGFVSVSGVGCIQHEQTDDPRMRLAFVRLLTMKTLQKIKNSNQQWKCVTFSDRRAR